jgi:hypothetical protein
VTLHDTLNGPGGTENLRRWGSFRSTFGGRDAQSYDDFVVTSTATITTLRWQGIYAPSNSTASSFYIAFIEDIGNGRAPGGGPDPANPGRPRALYAITASPADVNERLDVEVPCVDIALQCGLYDYSITLPTPFAVAAGVPYWLLIQAEFTTRNSSSWHWRQSLRDNRHSRSDIANADHPWDYAFSLRGILGLATQ